MPNLFDEQSLLSTEQRSRWMGFPLLWLGAHGTVRTGPTSSARPVVAMLDAGAAAAEFGFLRRTARIDVGAGAIGLFLPGERKFTCWSSHLARRLIVDLDVEYLRQAGLLSEEFLDARWRQDLDFRDPALAMVLRAMANEIAIGCPNGALFAQSLSLGVAGHLLARHVERARVVRERGRLTPEQMRRVDDVIEACMGASLTLPMMASAAGFSASHFVRLLRNTVGCSPHRYLTQRRIELACELLVHSDLPLVVVAERAGFASQSHMSTVLRKSTGSSPAELRRGRIPRRVPVDDG